MKRLTISLLVLVLIMNLTLVGCGSKQEVEDSGEDKKW